MLLSLGHSLSAKSASSASDISWAEFGGWVRSACISRDDTKSSNIASKLQQLEIQLKVSELSKATAESHAKQLRAKLAAHERQHKALWARTGNAKSAVGLWGSTAPWHMAYSHGCMACRMVHGVQHAIRHGLCYAAWAYGL